MNDTGTGMQPALEALLSSEGKLRASAVQPQRGVSAPVGASAPVLQTPAEFDSRDNVDFKQTSGLEQLQAARELAAKQTEQRQELAEVGKLGAAGYAALTTTTATINRELRQHLQGIEPPQHGYAPSTEEYLALASEFNLGADPHVQNRLMQASSPEQMRRYARDMQAMQEYQRLIGDHWLINMAVQTADLYENLALAGATLATGGAAAVVGVPLRIARIAHAVTSAGALVGTMHVASELGGQELTTEGALLSVALSAPLTYAFNKRMINKHYAQINARHAAKALESYKPGSGTARKVDPDAPTSHPDVDAPVMQRKAQEADTPALRAHRELIQRVKAGVSTARKGVAALTARGSWRAYLPESIRTASDSVPRMLQDVQTEIQNLRHSIKEAGGAHKAPEAATRLRELRTELKQLDQPESVVAAKYADVTPAEYNKAVKEAKELHAQDLKEATADLEARIKELEHLKKSEPPKTEADAILEEVDLANSAAEPAITRDITDALRHQEQQMRDAGMSPEAIEAASAKAVQLARNQLLTGQASPQGIAKGIRYFTELMSEHAKVTAGIPEIEKFVSKVLDDPLMRPGLIGESASSNFAVFMRRANKLSAEWDTAIYDAVHERSGLPKWRTFMGYTDKYIKARNDLEDAVAGELLRREGQVLRGEVVTSTEDALVARLANQYEDMGHAMADQARIAGLGGFEDYMRSAGYFHRSWNWENMNRILSEDTSGAMRQALATGIRRGNQQLTAEEANLIANAIVVRTRNKAHSARNDAMGQVGALEIESLAEMLMESGAKQPYIDSIMNRLTQRLEEQGSVKYAKRRIPIDMAVRFRTDSGEALSLQSLIDTDLTRLFANYSTGMSGRSALAKVGIGGDTHGIDTHLQHYSSLLDKHPLSGKQKKEMLSKYEDLLSDFTGIRKEGQVLGEGLQVGKAIATATMLGSTGLLQIPEGSIGAARLGMLQTTKAIFKEFPGIKQLLTAAAKDKALLDEWHEVFGIDFRTDLRIESWKRQTELGFPTDGTAIRLATGMQQMTPTVTGQRWVHGMQSDAFVKLHMRTLYRAATGDKKSLGIIQDAGTMITDDMLGLIKSNASVRSNGTLESLNLARLPHHVQDAIVQQMTRLQDSTLLHQRPGWGTSYRHSGVGQILGQFTSYVGMAHNVVMRKNYHHDGLAGIAKVLAYQYPIMLMTTYMNELRKGNVLDLDDDEDMKLLVSRALSYSAAIGMLGDVASTVLPGAQGRSVAAMAPLQSLQGIAKGMGYLAEGEMGNAASEAVGVANALTLTGAIGGSEILRKSLQSDD